MKSFWGILFLVFSMKSCILIHVDDSVDLGNSYRYIQSNPRTIINNRGSQNKDMGQIVVGPHVVEYKFDDTYIIAKTQNEIYIHDSLKVFHILDG